MGSVGAQVAGKRTAGSSRPAFRSGAVPAKQQQEQQEQVHHHHQQQQQQPREKKQQPLERRREREQGGRNHPRQDGNATSDGSDGWGSAPLVAPVLFGGPSNQIYHLKEAVFNIRACQRMLALVVPPLIPHYLQLNDDRVVPFSKYFDLSIGGGRVLEEHALVRAHSGPWPLNECTVYYSPAHDFDRFATQNNIRDNPALHQCRKFTNKFLRRTNLTLCRHITYATFDGNLCALSAKLHQARGAHALSFACNLKVPALQRSFILRPERLGANYDDWVATARAVRLKVVHPVLHATLAVQMRVPDDVFPESKHQHRLPAGYACLCVLTACKHCDPSAHIYTPVERLIEFIRAQVAAHPAMRGITDIHIMSNSPAVADPVSAGLKAAGFAVTASHGNTLDGLLNDYSIAAQSQVFWAIQPSSITTNIIHARLAEGRSLDSVVFWENIWPTNTTTEAAQLPRLLQ